MAWTAVAALQRRVAIHAVDKKVLSAFERRARAVSAIARLQLIPLHSSVCLFSQPPVCLFV